MKEEEIINNFITRIIRLVNQVKACGETVTEQYVVTKILRSLTPRFDNVVVAIEELKDLVTMRKEELQSSLEDHEKRMGERNSNKAKVEISLQALFNDKDKRSKGKWTMKSKGNFSEFWWKRASKLKKNRLFKGVRAVATRIVVKETLEVKRRGLTRVRNNALSVKGSVILQENAMQTRRNVKRMNSRLQDKILIKRIHFWL